MFYVALAGAIFIGLVLGLFGAGGAILTIPILSYLLGINPHEAIIYSYFIVGVISTTVSIPRFIRKEINLKALLWFGIPSAITLFISRKYIVPYIPNSIVQDSDFEITKGNATMLLLSLILAWSGFKMLKNNLYIPSFNDAKLNSYKILLIGISIGLLTGFVGVGGGFIIVPSLVLLLRLEPNAAVINSLAILSVNNLVGFIVSRDQVLEINWTILIFFTVSAFIGTGIGIRLRVNLGSDHLMKYFAYILLLVSVLVLLAELNKIFYLRII
ncbi:MAG: sulfite exporter TauE/SafE family protein [Saprospiraceae bacterium]